MTGVITATPFPDCLLLLQEEVPLIICDPPYGGILPVDWDVQSANGYLDIAALCAEVMVDGGSLYLWGGIGRQQEPLSRVEQETDLTLWNLITWKKRRAYGKKDDYLFTREECAWLVKGNGPRTFHVPYLDEKRGYAGFNAKYPAKSEYKRRSNVWTDVTELFRGKVHPAEKPSQLAQIMIETHTEPGELVADFFAGSGSTGVAAIATGRRYFLAERKPEHFETITKRLAAESAP